MKQLGLLTSFFILLLLGTNLYAQAGGQTPQKAPAKKKHTQTNWIQRTFGQDATKKWERESKRKVREYAKRDHDREYESGVAEMFDKKPHVSNPKKALRMAQKRDRMRDKESGVIAHFDERHVSNPEKSLRDAKKRDKKRDRESGVDANFK
jgi:hypothetical protein